MRIYNEPIPNYADVYTIEEWNEAVASGLFTDWDGYGCWCRDGMESYADPFEDPQEDATHVAWYNR